MGSTPEERLASPLRWDPPDIPPDTLERFEGILAVAIEGNMLKASAAESMLKILRVNPHARLSRLGQRLTILEDTMKTLSSVDRRLQDATEGLRAEFDFLIKVIEANPEWEKPE